VFLSGAGWIVIFLLDELEYLDECMLGSLVNCIVVINIAVGELFSLTAIAVVFPSRKPP
jgi:hypothetical protein